jgi:hypothetical protein
MSGLLRDVTLVLALIAALAVVASFSAPTDNYLLTGHTCHGIVQRLAAKQFRDLTPDEETDMASCSSP